MVPQNNRIYVCGNKCVFSADSLTFKLHKPIEAIKSCFTKKNVKILFKQEMGLPSATLKKIVLKAHKTKLTWANKNKVIMEFLTMGKQN